ncbi:MAG: gfo/Idh/MocA family oxidoreductase [Chloroflexota bacterium]|nr:MAG: gfo/Idh/MocA family oxidoreductase [Chloroflexota bacterium]
MTNTQPVYTVAVAGLGKRGVHHAEALSKNPRFQLVGLCDIDLPRLEAARQKFGVSYGNTDAAQMLNDTRPDVFVFCTLPQIRMPMIRAGVEAGVRLIAYEKPVAMSMNEGLEMYDLLHQAGIKTVVSHQHRYGDHYQKVKELIASGSIGRVHTVYGHATGWMMHMMSHMVEYATWYNDLAEVEWVAAQAAGKEKFSDVHASPDYICALLQYSNGVRGIIECGAGAPDVPEVDAWWRKCRIGAQGAEGFAEVLTGGGWRAMTKNGFLSGPGGMDYEHDMPPYIQDIASWLDDPAAVHPCNGEQAFKGLQVMMAACRSVVQRGKVTLPLGPGEPELEALERVLPG